MPPSANVLPEPEAGPRRSDLSGELRSRLEQRLERARQAAADRRQLRPAITRTDQEGPAPLSHAQERLWFLDQLMPDRGLYNVYQAMRLHGRLDAGALGRALDELLRRHEVFRTNFHGRDDGPVQIIAPPGRVQFDRIDFSALPDAKRESTLLDRLRTEAKRPFDLTKDFLLRATLVHLDSEENVLLLVMHHIVSDGWSLGLLFRELGIMHEAYSSGQASPLPGLPIRFIDYARWERETLQGEALERPLAYWRRQLAGAEALALASDRPRPLEPSIRGATRLATIPPGLVREARALCQRESATLFMAVLAAFQALLHRYTRQDDIVIGSCVAGRNQVELEQLAGFFVNTLVLRTNAAGRPTFREWLHRTRETVLGAMAHQDLPFEKLVAELQPDRSPVRNPFFQVMFVLQSAGGPAPRAAGLRFEPLEFDNGTSKFDLALSLAEGPEGELKLSLEYRTDLFEAATIDRLIGHYQSLLAGAIAAPDRYVDDLPLLSAGERRQLLAEWSGPRPPYPRDASLVSLFAQQVAARPDTVAVQDDHGRLSYRELDRQANRLAHYLRARGAGPGTFVALCCERSPGVVVILLAILKAGAAYVSLDPAYPAERIGFMLADARPVLLLVDESARALAESALAGLPSDAPQPAVIVPAAVHDDISREPAQPPAEHPRADSLAYVCYTSGSTGRPKGVCIPHRGVVRLLVGTDYVSFGPEDVVLQFAPVAFDASTFEIWAPLLHGGRVAVCPPGLPSLAELGEFIQRHDVTTAFLTTGLFHQLIDEQAARLTGLRHLITGGEVLSPEHAARALALLPSTRLYNAYGPTENTTFTTVHPLAVPLPTGPVPIGRPIAHTTVYVLDAHRQLVPVGVPGELYTGGDGLARGYLRRPELDEERFVPDPFSPEPGARLYRTGDLVRWRADGTLEFLGRVDRQIKLRGFRIEPGEIEAVLAAHPAVGQAAVLADHGSAAGARLVAYVTGRDGPPPDPLHLRTYLEEKLPSFMVPAVVMPVPAIPLNANGKVDRSALPAPELTPSPGRPAYLAPRDATETALVALWEKILGVAPVGVHDTFFQLGGHSMAGVRLFARIEKELGARLPLASLFAAPTVAQLAARLREPAANTACSSLVALRAGGTRPPVYFIHGAGGGNLWIYTNLVPHLPPEQPVYALESRAMRGLPEFESVEEMAAHYLREIRSVQPQGPYFLSGYCFGGNVAYEMARQLEAAGESVGFVGLLDSSAANSSYQQLPWWRPSFHFRFVANTAHWLAGFVAQPWRDQARFIARKGRLLARRAADRLRGRATGLVVEEVIDTSLFPEIELGLWQAHLRAIARYHPGPFQGRVTLFRTRGHPFLCSFDPHFGWAPLARGGVELVPVPGAHEQIFMVPHVLELGARFRDHLARAQNLPARAS